jgi:hypothetical protein
MRVHGAPDQEIAADLTPVESLTVLPLAFFRHMVLDCKLCVVESEKALPTHRVFPYTPKGLLRRFLRRDKPLGFSPFRRFVGRSGRC